MSKVASEETVRPTDLGSFLPIFLYIMHFFCASSFLFPFSIRLGFSLNHLHLSVNEHGTFLFEISSMAAMILNFMYQPDQIGCPDTRLSIIFASVCEGVPRRD